MGLILGVDQGMVKRHFKKRPDHPDDSSRNGRPSFFLHDEREERIGAVTETYQLRRPMSVSDVNCSIA
jgi:hypothetical protein